jgi:serine/threonine protein kinase
LIGVGSRGNVYAGKHLLMHKRVAVKILHRELSSMPEFTARFEREAVAVANIDHPNVASATDFGKLPDGSMFLVLEFVEGKCLRDEIAAGPLSPDRALRIARQIASALASAHALGIVHRDLKPENVMLLDREGGQDFVKVLDFGVAQVPVGDTGVRSKAALTQAGTVFGTPEYMAPEQALGQKVDGRADLYALGAIAFEMLSGERPFSSVGDGGILNQQLSKPPPALSARAPAVRVPARAEQLVTRLLATNARDRYQTADELVQALDDLLALRAGEVAASAPITRMLGSVAQSSGAPGVPRVSLPSAARPEEAPSQSSVARVAAKQSFSADEPLPAFTFPVLDEAKKQELLRSVEAVRAVQSQSSVARAAAKESFSADEPLPAFTFPVLDEAKKQELLRSVEAARAAQGQLAPVVPPPSVRPMPKLAGRDSSLSSRFSELRRIGIDAWKRGSALARRWFESACTFIDHNRSRLPARMRDPLSKVRSEWIVGLLTLLVFGILIGVLLRIGSGPSEKPAPVKLPSAPVVSPKEDAVPRGIEEPKNQ